VGDRHIKIKGIKMEKTKTERGFDMITFSDMYGHECYIQKSSLATAHAIWLGVSSPEPRIMAKDARRLGVDTEETVGWIDYPVPEEVLITTQMHIDQDQAKELIKVLEKFVETGYIS